MVVLVGVESAEVAKAWHEAVALLNFRAVDRFAADAVEELAVGGADSGLQPSLPYHGFQ